uniref:Uncharacterized protein n=1 Tax=Meloidogyne enterolobii TaxID=390850 RepID=A0A6V7US20_MELEN|nr:unnamed protein product [Meloidogyne enterolobii]
MLGGRWWRYILLYSPLSVLCVSTAKKRQKWQEQSSVVGRTIDRLAERVLLPASSRPGSSTLIYSLVSGESSSVRRGPKNERIEGSLEGTKGKLRGKENWQLKGCFHPYIRS